MIIQWHANLQQCVIVDAKNQFEKNNVRDPELKIDRCNNDLLTYDKTTYKWILTIEN